MCTDQAAITFLKSKQICTLFALLKAQDLLSDILKSGQYLDQTDSVGLCNGICKVCGNDRLNQRTILRQSLFLLLSAKTYYYCPLNFF